MADRVRVPYPRLTAAAALVALCSSTAVGCGDGDVLNALTETTTEWIPTIEQRYPVLADLELDTAERTLFGRNEGTIGPLGDPSGPNYSQHYAPRPGFTVDDAFDELVAVLESEGWGPFDPTSSTGRSFCADKADPTEADMFDIIKVYRSTLDLEDPSVSFRFQIGTLYPCREPGAELSS